MKTDADIQKKQILVGVMVRIPTGEIILMRKCSRENSRFRLIQEVQIEGELPEATIIRGVLQKIGIRLSLADVKHLFSVHSKKDADYHIYGCIVENLSRMHRAPVVIEEDLYEINMAPEGSVFDFSLNSEHRTMLRATISQIRSK